MLEVSDAPMNFSSTFGIAEHDFRLVFGRTAIDYDPNKDQENRTKHKYGLESAVWLLEKLLLPNGDFRPHAVSDSFVEQDEVRHIHLCVDDGDNVVLLVTTMRNDETVRVISLRSASKDERMLFQDLTGYAKKGVN